MKKKKSQNDPVLQKTRSNLTESRFYHRNECVTEGLNTHYDNGSDRFDLNRERA